MKIILLYFEIILSYFSIILLYLLNHLIIFFISRELIFASRQIILTIRQLFLTSRQEKSNVRQFAALSTQRFLKITQQFTDKSIPDKTDRNGKRMIPDNGNHPRNLKSILSDKQPNAMVSNQIHSARTFISQWVQSKARRKRRPSGSLR